MAICHDSDPPSLVEKGMKVSSGLIIKIRWSGEFFWWSMWNLYIRNLCSHLIFEDTGVHVTFRVYNIGDAANLTKSLHCEVVVAIEFVSLDLLTYSSFDCLLTEEQ